jgi:hypothetical protein
MISINTIHASRLAITFDPLIRRVCIAVETLPALSTNTDCIFPEPTFPESRHKKFPTFAEGRKNSRFSLF